MTDQTKDAPAPQITLGAIVDDVVNGSRGEAIGISIFKYEAAIVLVKFEGGRTEWIQATRLSIA